MAPCDERTSSADVEPGVDSESVVEALLSSDATSDTRAPIFYVASAEQDTVLPLLQEHGAQVNEQRLDRYYSGDEATVASLRSLEAEADSDAWCTDEARLLEELEAREMAPSLQTLAYLPPEEVAQRLLQVLRLVTCQTSKASTARAAELRALMWAHEWLALQPSARISFTRRLVEGTACMEAAVQAQHLELLAELRLAVWEAPEEERHRWRLARGLRIGRGMAVVLLALRSEELDAIGKAFADTLSDRLTHLGAARAVVRMSPESRSQLAKVLVYEEILPLQDSKRLFNAIDCVIDALGTEKLEATLTALDAAMCLGGGAFRMSGQAFGTLSSLGSDALGTMSTVSSGVVDAIGSAAAAGAGVTASFLYMPGSRLPEGYATATPRQSGVDAASKEVSSRSEGSSASGPCNDSHSSLTADNGPPAPSKATPPRRQSQRPSHVADFI